MIVVLSLLTLICLALPSWAELEVLQLQAQVLADHRAAGQDGHVAEHRLAAIAEPGRLDRADVEHAAQLVDDQGRQGFALDVLGDDQERLARLGDLLEQRDHLAEAADLLLVEQDQRVLEDDLHRRRAGDEVGAQVALVELHPLDELEGRWSAVLPSSTVITPSRPTRSTASASMLPIVGSLLAEIVPTWAISSFLETGREILLGQLGDGGLDGLFDAAADGRGVGPGGDVLEPLAIDRAGQDGRGRRAVAGHVGGLGRDHVDELGAHVLERVGAARSPWRRSRRPW